MKHNIRDAKGRFCKKAPVKPITKGYKGFHKGLICKGKQYEVGKTYEEDGKRICKEGMMHFCESPLDVLEFYPAIDPYTGEPNEFAEIEALGKTIKRDNKSATNKLRIVKKLSLEELIQAASKAVSVSNVATTKSCSYVATTGDSSNAATAGDHSRVSTTGYDSHATTVGRYAHAATTGAWSRAVTTGSYSNAVTADDCSDAATGGHESDAATVGDSSDAVTSGCKSHATTTGEASKAVTTGRCSNAATLGNYSCATAAGKYSIAAALGIESKAKAALGSWIVLAEYDSIGVLSCVKAAKVDGQKIKPNTFYRLEKGEFVED